MSKPLELAARIEYELKYLRESRDEWRKLAYQLAEELENERCRNSTLPSGTTQRPSAGKT